MHAITIFCKRRLYRCHGFEIIRETTRPPVAWFVGKQVLTIYVLWWRLSNNCWPHPTDHEVRLLKIATVMDMGDSAIRIGNIERSRALAERDARASILSMSGGIPRASFAILGDLGMSEEAIAAYCHRFGNKRTANVNLYGSKAETI